MDAKGLGSLIEQLDTDDPIAQMESYSALCAAGEPAADALSSLLVDASRSEAFRWRAAAVLGQIGGQRAAAALLELLGEAHADIRQTVIFALGQVQSLHTVPVLADLLLHSPPAPQPMFTIASALARADRARALPILSAARTHPEDRVRRAVRAVLANLAEQESG